MSRAQVTGTFGLKAASAAVFGVGALLVMPLPASADPTPPVPAAGTTAAPQSAPAKPQMQVPLTVTRPQPGSADALDRREGARAAMLDARLAELRTGLQLTASQAPLWPPVAAAIRGVENLHLRRWRQTLAAADNSVDGLKLQGAHMVEVGTAMGKLAAATGPLLASLTPDQKSRLPMLLQRVRPRRIMARAFELPEDTQQEGQGQGQGRGMGGGRGVGRGFGMGGPGQGSGGARGPVGSGEPDARGGQGGAGSMSQQRGDQDDDD